MKAEKLQLVMLLDDRSRMVRLISEARSGERWVVQTVRECKYDRPSDGAKFEPHFGDDVRVLDADAAFDEFVDLSKAVHREERDGLAYAIHYIQRFDNGGIYAHVLERP